MGDLVTVYIGYVRSIVEYTCPGYHGSIYVHQTQKIERIQRRACRFILGSTYTSCTDALTLTGLQTLEERRQDLYTQFVKKCTTSEKYARWFPLNNSSHCTCLVTPVLTKLPSSELINMVIFHPLPHWTFRLGLPGVDNAVFLTFQGSLHSRNFKLH